MAKRAFELQSTTANEARRFFDEHRRVGRHFYGGFVDHRLPYPDLACHDRALGLFAAREKAAVHQENIEPRLFRLRRLSHGAAYERSSFSIDCRSSTEARRR